MGVGQNAQAWCMCRIFWPENTRNEHRISILEWRQGRRCTLNPDSLITVLHVIAGHYEELATGHYADESVNMNVLAIETLW